MEDSILTRITQRVATITINREARRNSLDHVAMRALHQTLDDLSDEAVNVIVITGAGTASFCAGDDIKAYAERTREESARHHERGLETFDKLENHPCLVIAAIEGFCLGGGLELALSCDYRISSEGAQFGLPEVRKLGALPSWGGVTRLPKVIGLGRAKQMVLMGERVSADQALAMGLIAQCVPAGSALERATELAQDYAANVPREVIALAKRTLDQSYGASSSVAHLTNLLMEKSQAFEGQT